MVTITSVTPPPRRFLSSALGAAAALAAWAAFTQVRDSLPAPLQLVIAAAFLVFGPGIGLTFLLLAPLSWLGRVVLGFSFGVAFVPIVAHVLGGSGLMPAYPFVAAGAGGAALGYWLALPASAPAPAPARLATLALVVVTLGTGAAVFTHRLVESRTETAVSGGDDYDSYDLSYYAAIAAELSHTVPPSSPFISGRLLDHAFYPQVVTAVVHRFGHVGLLDLYFRYAMPLFVMLAVLCCFLFVESIAGVGTAFLAALFFGIGSNFAYLFVMFLKLPPWDDVIWAHNLQGAGAEVLFYGNWAPSFVATFAGFYALHAALRQGRFGWILAAGAAFATTILSKPWVFTSVVPALALMAVASYRDKTTARRLLLVIVAAVLVAAPLLYRVVTLFDDAQVVFAPAFFPIPLAMAARTGFRDVFVNAAGAFGLSGAAQEGLAGVLATPLFLVGTIGFRVIGLPSFWRSLWNRGRPEPVLSVLAWSIVAAYLASTFIVSVPYHETVQIHQLALFLMAVFAAQGVMAVRNPRTRVVTALVVTALAVPSTLQYVQRKWQDATRPPLALASTDDVAAAGFLRDSDPDRTVLLHDRPNDPTLLGILAERRSVLSWAGYVRGSGERRADVEAFFASPDAATATAILKKYRPTYVVEYLDRDKINPQVRDQLELKFRKRNVAIYRVREP